MRKLIFAGALLALTLFGVGYIIGQVRGPSSGFAAGTGSTVLNGGAFTQPFATRWDSTGTGTAALPKHADGTVTAVSGNTITIQADNDASNPNEYTAVTTIQLTGSTQYGGGLSKSSISVGSHLIASGTVSSDGKTMTASQVSAGGAGGCPHGAPSTGTSSSSGSSTTNA